MGNEFLEYLPEFYNWYENEYDEQPVQDEKAVLEDFCDYLQQHYKEKQ